MADPIPQREPSRNMIVDVYTGETEETYFKSPMDDKSFISPYNPDDLWQKHGNYSIYEDMLNDDQVSICLQLKKDLVIGSGFNFISEDDGQEEITKFLADSLDDSCLIEGAEEILSAYENGFSLTEKIFGKDDDGMVILKDLKTRHPNSWTIYQDDFGNVTKYEQNTVAGNKDIDPNSLIHYVNNRKYQNPYGKSDLRACYAAWFAKRQVIRYYAIFLEKAASPTPVAKYDQNAPQNSIQQLFNTIKKLQASTAMVIPKEIEVDFLESRSDGQAYARAINIFNMFIGRSLFIPDLLGLTGSETGGGSYSLGKEQMNLFFMHIQRRRAQLEKLLNKHIVWPMIVSNFGFVENYPKLRFKPIDDMKAVELAKIWLEAVKSKVFPPNDEEINYFRSLCGFPEGEVEETPAPQMPTGIQPGLPVDAQEEPESADDVEESDDTSDIEETEDVVEEDMSAKDETPEEDKLPEDDKLSEEDKKTFKGKLPTGDYHRKVDFKKIKTKLEDYDNSILAEAKPIIEKQFRDLYDQIQKKNILKNQDISKIDKIQIKYLKELKQILKTSFLSIYKDGNVMAQQELLKTKYETPIPTDVFLEMLEDETFQYVGDYAYAITKEMRAELIAAIKDGRPLSTVFDNLDERGKQLASTSIERFARTKHTEVMNKGRLAFFEDSGVVAAYQYSAILDSVTSEICRGLDGKIFEAGSQPVPPMHFNCRSLLVPITKYETYKPSEKAGGMPIDQFIEEKKGSGFAKYSKGPQVGDPGVEFVTENISPLIDETTYSKDGKPFQITVVTYKTKDRSEVKSIRHMRVNNAE